MDLNDRQTRRLMRQRGAAKRDLGDVSFGFDIAGTPARVPSARKTPATRRSSGKKTPAQVNVLEDSNTQPRSGSASKKRKRDSAPAPQQAQDELAEEEEEPLFMSARSTRVLSPTGSAIENAPPSIESKKYTPASRANPRTPLVPVDSNPVSSGARRTKSTQKSSRRTKSPMETIMETGAGEDELSYESIEAIDLPQYDPMDHVEESIQEITGPGATRPSETTFAPEFEGTRDVTTRPPMPQTLPTSIAPSRPTYTPVAEARPKKKRKTNRKPRTSGTSQTVAITVTRRSRKSQPDTDPLGAAPIPSVNSADVLLQISKEMCTKHIEKTQERAKQREFEKKMRFPLFAFVANIEDLLGDVSRAQNDVYAMRSRIRALKRQQSDLRAELMRAKHSREQILFEIDQVRSDRAAKVQSEKEEWELGNSLHDMQMAVQRGRARTNGMKEGELVFDEREVGWLDVQEGMKLNERLRGWNELLESAANGLVEVA